MPTVSPLSTPLTLDTISLTAVESGDGGWVGIPYALGDGVGGGEKGKESGDDDGELHVGDERPFSVVYGDNILSERLTEIY